MVNDWLLSKFWMHLPILQFLHLFDNVTWMHIRFHIGAFDATLQAYPGTPGNLKGLPRGIIQATSDFEFRPLWSPSSLRSKVSIFQVLFLLYYGSI